MSLQTKNKYDPNSPFHIYYDLHMTNKDYTKSDTDCRFYETRNNPYLMCPENYFVSVSRFHIDTPNLPVFIPEMDFTGNKNTSLTSTKYVFTMKYLNWEIQKIVNYYPENKFVKWNEDNFINGEQNINSEYYYVYNYQHWIKLLNETLLLLTQIFNATTAQNIKSPFFEFDVSNKTLILMADSASFGDLTTNVQLYCNTALQRLLSGFQFQYMNYSNLTSLNYKFVIINTGSNNYIMEDDSIFIQMYSDSSPVSLWNPIQSIVFTSVLLPISPSFQSPLTAFNSLNYSISSNTNTTQIITDFQVAVDGNNNYRNSIDYIPSAEYRFVDMYGNSPLSTIDISVYWKDRGGNLHPLTLTAGSNANIKLLFRRKDFNSISLF